MQSKLSGANHNMISIRLQIYYLPTFPIFPKFTRMFEWQLPYATLPIVSDTLMGILLQFTKSNLVFEQVI